MNSGQPDMFGAPDVGGERDATDRYFTPAWCTHALVDYLGPRLHGLIWEPCAGQGHIVDVLRGHGHEVLATDINPGRSDILKVDFLSTKPTGNYEATWCCTNPPYSTDTATAAEVVDHALSLDHQGVAMLLRIGWQEPCEDREELFLTNPPTDLVTLPRVNYIGAPSGNNQTSVWFIWEKGHPRQPPHWYGQEIRKPGYWSRR